MRSSSIISSIFLIIIDWVDHGSGSRFFNWYLYVDSWFLWGRRSPNLRIVSKMLSPRVSLRLAPTLKSYSVFSTESSIRPKFVSFNDLGCFTYWIILSVCCWCLFMLTQSASVQWLSLNLPVRIWDYIWESCAVWLSFVWPCSFGIRDVDLLVAPPSDSIHLYLTRRFLL